MKRRTLLKLGAGALGVAHFAHPALSQGEAILPPEPQSLEEFRRMRFGLFIHWGPVSLTGKEIGWSRASETNERLTRWQDYDQLYKRFNPTEFDADEWVSIASDAGMNYMVLTSRHHDGFCLWDSAYTDYDIMSTPFQRDVMKELADACKRSGLAFGPYFSICDWRHPDYGYSHRAEPGFSPEGGEPDFSRFYEYTTNQLREQNEKYGPFLVYWFDGEWEEPWTHEYGIKLNNFCRRVQPDVLINNRVDKGRKGMQGMFADDGVQYAGDFGTPEQEVGLFNRDTPWETCMTIGTQWAWKPDDRIKSLKECLRTFIDTIGGDGNLLFNVGPMPDGRIEARQVERLREMGDWIKPNSQAIYATRGGPYMPGEWGASTCKGNRIYLFVYQTENQQVKLPPLPRELRSVKLLNGVRVSYKHDDAGLFIRIPEGHGNPIATVIELSIEGEAFEIDPIETKA